MRHFFRKRVSAFLLTLVMVITMVPAVSARTSADIEYEVDKGDSIALEKTDFRSVWRQEYTGSPYYVVFTDYDDLDDYGCLSATDYAGDTVTLDESDLNNAYFYYNSSNVPNNVDYELDDLTFVANRRASSGTLRLKFEVRGESNRYYVSGIMNIEISGSGSSSKGDITYEVDAGDEVVFDEDDFEDFYDENCSGTFKYVTFEAASRSDYADGYIYYRYGNRSETYFPRTELDEYKFYYDDSDYGDYALDKLSFVADDDFEGPVTLTFTVYGGNNSSTSRSASGTLIITTDSKSSSSSSKKGDITYEVDAGEEVVFDEDDFEDFYDENCSGTFKYVTFSKPASSDYADGYIYYRYGNRSETYFTRSELDEYKFYYDDSDYGDYALDKLSFVADGDFEGPVKVTFTVYGGSNSSTSRSASGTLVINAEDSGTTSVSRYAGNIRYSTTPSTALQINANDIARFLKQYTGDSLRYMILTGIPSTGSLYYNYYDSSQYGSSTRLQMTATAASGKYFSYSPTSASEYDMSELTYIPSGSGYCTAISFTAYGASGLTASGTILISVSSSAVSEVYTVTTKGTSVTFPVSAVYSAVASATGQGLSGIQLLELPTATAGTLYSGNAAANTTSVYSYASGTSSMSQLFFMPKSGYSGSVVIPYVALDSRGVAIAAGQVSIGVVSSVKKFNDVTTSTWCYKYVTELASAGIISGYSNGTFQEKNTITYGAALKLIMLAAGYSEQAPTVKGSTFSGYLARAKADGLVTGNPNLSGSITRLQIAQIAAKAMQLSTSNLSSKKPFTDTSDVYVQALNAAGIIEGYFANGNSTYKPNNTLTRGQVSAIVWRMRNYTK